MRKHVLITAMALAVGAAGCEQATGPDSGLAPAEMVELSDAMIQDGLSETADTTVSSTLADGVSMDVVTNSTEFTRTHACVLGGEVVMAGTRSRTRDTETRTGTMDVSATRTFVECARPLDESDVTVTLNGAVTFTAHREWAAGQWNGTQELTLVGSIDWATDDDRSGTCEIDIQAGIDPETQTRTVTGTICDEDVGEFDGWSFSTMGQGPGYRHQYGGQGPHGSGMGG